MSYTPTYLAETILASWSALKSECKMEQTILLEVVVFQARCHLAVAGARDLAERALAPVEGG